MVVRIKRVYENQRNKGQNKKREEIRREKSERRENLEGRENKRREQEKKTTQCYAYYSNHQSLHSK